jgi:hypothetical protein
LTPKIVLKATVAVLVAAAVVLYAGDFAWFEYRMRNIKPNDPLQSMTFYYATDIKGGKVEVFDDQPQTETCVHSIFPHGGYKPCWRFSRSGIVRISRVIVRSAPVSARNHFACWTEAGDGVVLVANAGMAIERAPFFPTERTAKK